MGRGTRAAKTATAGAGYLDGLVLVPVPAHLAEQVSAYATALVAGALPAAVEQAGAALSADAGAEPGDGVAVPGQGVWTQEMVAELVDQVRYPAVLALFEACAAAPDRWVDKTSVQSEAGVSPYQLRNELGALSKLTRRLFGAPTWPVQWQRTAGTYEYRMDAVMAGWWAAARTAGQGSPNSQDGQGAA